MAITLDDLLKLPGPPRTLDDLLELPPRITPELEAEKGQGFWRSIIEDPEEKLPFIGAGVTAGRFLEIKDAAKRLQSGDYKAARKSIAFDLSMIMEPEDVEATTKKITKERDVATVEEYLRRAHKKYTTM
ncbi:MAG: hypothetical protein ACXABY_22450, partial [Candidatus Thorarchaeota archaeon]